MEYYKYNVQIVYLYCVHNAQTVHDSIVWIAEIAVYPQTNLDVADKERVKL